MIKKSILLIAVVFFFSYAAATNFVPAQDALASVFLSLVGFLSLYLAAQFFINLLAKYEK